MDFPCLRPRPSGSVRTFPVPWPGRGRSAFLMVEALAIFRLMRPKRPPLPSETVGVQSPTPCTTRAITFGGERHHDDFFSMSFDSPMMWFESGSMLLRASDALLRQVMIDADAMRRWMKASFEANAHLPGQERADIRRQVAFLGVLAVENGLKGVIAADHMIARAPDPSPGKLHADFNHHDLAALANKATVSTTDPGESAVLVGGRWVTEWLGRYPTMTTAADNPNTWRLGPLATFEACERLFLRCVEEAATRLHPRFGTGKTLAEYVDDDRKHWATRCGGVDDLGDIERKESEVAHFSATGRIEGKPPERR